MDRRRAGHFLTVLLLLCSLTGTRANSVHIPTTAGATVTQWRVSDSDVKRTVEVAGRDSLLRLVPGETRDEQESQFSKLGTVFDRRVASRAAYEAENGYPNTTDDLKLVLVMLAQNESKNFRRFLSSWTPLIDGYVIGIDDRTTDNSTEEVRKAFQGIPGVAIRVRFDGFGPTWTKIFAAARELFPQSTHLMMTESDWEADQISFRREEIAKNIRLARKRNMFLVMTFDVVDRGRMSVRPVDYLIPNSPNVFVKYRMHEQVTVSNVDARAVATEKISFRVVEHSGGVLDRLSRCDRALREISLNERDQQDFPLDPRVLYYAGITRMTIGTHCGDRNATMREIAEVGLSDLMRRATVEAVPPPTSAPVDEMRWAAALWSAFHLHTDHGRTIDAEDMYLRAIQIDPVRAEPMMFLAYLYEDELQQRCSGVTAVGLPPRVREQLARALRSRSIRDAALGIRDGRACATLLAKNVAVSAATAAISEPNRRFSHNMHVYSCMRFVQLARAAADFLLLTHPREEARSEVQQIGREALRHIDEKCKKTGFVELRNVKRPNWPAIEQVITS